MNIAKKEQPMIQLEKLDMLTAAQRSKLEELLELKKEEDKNRQAIFDWIKRHRDEVLIAMGIEEKSIAAIELKTTITQIAEAYGCSVQQLIDYIGREEQIANYKLEVQLIEKLVDGLNYFI